jgi:peptidylprolyl isomerase
MGRFLYRFLLGLTLMSAMTLPANGQAADLENRLYLELDAGRVVIDLLPDVAPNHVDRIRTLARQGFYDGQVFFRVIDGFMAQTGDPGGTGTGGSDLPDLRAEFSDLPFERGVLGMARTPDPHSANSQFFITFAPAPWLDGQYTLFGRVVDGMNHVDAIARGEPPANPDRIISLRVAADVE